MSEAPTENLSVGAPRFGNWCRNTHGHLLTEHPQGDWVRWSDYEALRQRFERACQRVTQLESSADETPAPHDWEREITALLDGLGKKAIRVREGGGPENLIASLAVTLSSHFPSERVGPREPDNDMVICPNCTSQFVAIPVNVQARLRRINAYNDNPAHYDSEIDRLSAHPWRGPISAQETSSPRSVMSDNGRVEMRMLADKIEPEKATAPTCGLCGKPGVTEAVRTCCGEGRARDLAAGRSENGSALPMEK